ncbi:MAG: WhiB family transcriptional regulator [Ilumatobacter fluminis]|uniref:Transcriptional regulator WhiB n=1 Tax=Ilumatobacter fluminis TaxID=467091 RepID=A0A4R7HXN9_9ACTN|nr:WhiB family redox-sensing transcriptional regulator [Ilumatobacter fluminis]
MTPEPNKASRTRRTGGTVSAHELEWRMLGACRGLDPTIFYPDRDDEADVAKQVCAECSVQQTCLDYALTQREKAGVWGGATERDRRRILRQRRRTA